MYRLAAVIAPFNWKEIKGRATVVGHSSEGESRQLRTRETKKRKKGKWERNEK